MANANPNQSSIHDLVPMMVCNDVQRSIRFYQDVLGFAVVNRMDDVGNTGWANLRKENIGLMLSSPSHWKAPQQSGDVPLTDTVFYFYTDDVVQLKQSIEDSGTSVSDFAVRFYGMKEVEVQDPDGRLLIFGQETDEPPTPE